MRGMDDAAREQKLKRIFNGDTDGVEDLFGAKKDVAGNRMRSCRDENGEVGVGDSGLKDSGDFSGDKADGVSVRRRKRDKNCLLKGLLFSREHRLSDIFCQPVDCADNGDTDDHGVGELEEGIEKEFSSEVAECDDEKECEE